MVLYVVRPPNPPAGTDWEAIVPGQYIYDIAGITATLATGAGPSPTAFDSSGNAHNGTYGGMGPPHFVSGILPAGGDLALDCSSGTGGVNAREYVALPVTMVDWTQPWSVEWWEECSQPVGFILESTDTTITGAVTIGMIPDAGINGFIQVLTHNVFSEWLSNSVDVYDGNPHHVVVTYDGAAIGFYHDGVPIGLDATGNPMDVFTPDVTNIAANAAFTPACHATLDEFAIYDYQLNDAQVDAHFTAAAVSFADYSAAILADIPFSYYHLDDAIPPGGRQVTLEITDGTHTVELMPTGFARSTATGPFPYSWQPNLNSDTQTPNGVSTTVAIPRLLLPAGYTVGTRTLDIATSDQWSDVAIWWDSRYMDIGTGLHPYEFPPGAHLIWEPNPNAVH